jgi:RNA polymerase sigma-70 factor (family 1)
VSLPSSHNEKELLQQVAFGSEAAFTTIFNLHQERIYSVALMITHSDTLAEEIVQDIFLSIWLKKENLLNVENFTSWLFIITRNQAYHYLKKLARERNNLKNAANTIPMYETDTERMLAEKEYREALRIAIARLPEQQKQVYQLMREQQLSREQTAQQLGIHPETVKTHMARALKNIRAWCKSQIDLSIWLIYFSSL